MPVYSKFPDIDGESKSAGTDATPYGDELFVASETASSGESGDGAGPRLERPVYLDGKFLPASGNAKGGDGTDAADGTFDSADLIAVFQAGEYAASDPADDFML